MKKTNLLTTIGGIMAGFGVVPIAFGTAKIALPSWLYILCIFLAAMGPVLIGVSAKGQDEHSTLDEVKQSQADKGNGPPLPVPPSSGKAVAQQGKSN